MHVSLGVFLDAQRHLKSLFLFAATPVLSTFPSLVCLCKSAFISHQFNHTLMFCGCLIRSLLDFHVAPPPTSY